VKADLQTVTVDNGPIDRAFTFVKAAFERLGDVVTNRNVVRGVKLAIGDNKVPHGLGRLVTDWEILRKNAFADVKDSATVNANGRTFIILAASAAVTVDLRFS
jgi:hypothetical protein